MPTYGPTLASKIEYAVFVNRSVTDNAKVACIGVSADAYLQGATARTATGSPIGSGSSGTIEIGGPGSFEVGDVVQVNTTASPTGTITAIDRDANLQWKLTVTASGGSLTWAAGDRIVNTSRRPTLYKDFGLTMSYGSSATTSDSDGMVRCYTTAAAVDLVLAKTAGGTPSMSPTVVPDIDARDRSAVVNVRDFGGSLKAAVAYARNLIGYEGTTIYWPAGYYIYGASDLEITIDFACRIVGDGMWSTIMHVEGASGNQNKDFLTVDTDLFSLSDVSLFGYDTTGTGRCIVLGNNLATRGRMKITRCQIQDWPSYGIDIGGPGDPNTVGIDYALVEDCDIRGSNTNANLFIGLACTMCAVVDSVVTARTSPAGVLCFDIHSCANVLLINCSGAPSSLNDYAIRATYPGGVSIPSDAGTNLVIKGGDFEGYPAPTTETTPIIYIEGFTAPRVEDTLLFQHGSGIELKKTYGAKLTNLTLKGLGASGFEIKMTDTFHTSIDNCMYELNDPGPDLGARRLPVVTLSGANPGFTYLGGGIGIPQFYDDAQRDNAPSAGNDDKRARAAAGSMIFVLNPTTPASKLQIHDGSAWVGIPKSTGPTTCAPV